MATTGYAGYIEAEAGAGPIGSTLCGICTSAADESAKTAYLPALTNLMDGLQIRVRMKYSNIAQNPTLNVENTGAKPIYRYGTLRPGTTVETSWGAGSILPLTYDQETDAWYIDGWLNTNTTYPIVTTSAAGLMSAGDKTNLDALQTAKSSYDSLVTNKPKFFENKAVASSAWTTSGTYSGYGFQASIACDGIDSSWFPLVCFNPVNHNSYNFAGVAASGTNTVTIYASIKPTDNITIPTIACFKK